MSSTAKRTIIKQAYFNLTLEPPVAVGSTPTTAPSLPTNTPTTGPSATQTPGGTPSPQLCSNTWGFTETLTTFSVSVALYNPTALTYNLDEMSITWASNNNGKLDHIEFTYPPPGAVNARVWTGPTPNSPFTIALRPCRVNPGTSYVTFVFTKNNTTVSDITMYFSQGGSSCYLTTP